MRVSRNLLLAIIFCSFTTPHMAQQSTPDIQSAAARLARISEALNLTADQRAQILPIIRMETPQIQELMKDQELAPQQRVLKLAQIAANVDGKIQPILTQQQWQKWQIMRKEERQEILDKLNNN
jgi:transcriptional regulator of acetoin/glycerol metabolism